MVQCVEERGKSVDMTVSFGQELTASQLDEINLYVLDPAHISPSRSDATSNGHFPINNTTTSGTPRGFNLANMAPRIPNMPPATAFMPPMGQYPIMMPGASFGMDGAGRPGPMRTGPGRFNNRMAAPYDRSQRDTRNNRWNAGGGRLTPPRQGRNMGGQQRFPDAAPATMGPKEATAGRTMKSYEDLDAVGDGNDGQLDY